MSLSDLAADLGCSAEAIRGWVRQAAIDTGERVGSDEAAQLRTENAELRRRNKRLEEEREILKAAAAFFAHETPATATCTCTP